MLKKLSLVAIAVVGTSVLSTAPASANAGSCGANEVFNPNTFTCEPVPPIPTPGALLAVVTMGGAAIRKKLNQDAGTGE
ncbi:MAG: hypothetical protein HC799_04550 [Limnothrix sp. RL_2_0]|nr:hypothetical protein [Limnothrix sp. RL_2_0]